MPQGDTPMQYPYPYKTDDGLLQSNSSTTLPQITVVGDGTVGGSLTVNGALIATGSTAATVWTGSGSSSGKLFSSQKNIYALAANAEAGYQAINNVNATLDLSMASSLHSTFPNVGLIRQAGGIGINIRADTANKFIKLTTNDGDRLTITDSGVKVENLSASQLVATDASTILASIPYSIISTASNIVLRDSNAFSYAKQFVGDTLTVISAGTTTNLTATSMNEYILITGGTTQTFTLPDATTLPLGISTIFNNNAGGGVTIKNFASTTLTSIPVGGILTITLLTNSTQNGTWDYHFGVPSNTNWGTATLSTSANIITGAGISGPSGTAKFDISSTTGLGKFITMESTVATGTAPLVVASTTNVANLNASTLNGATFAAPGTIGGGTASGATFSTVKVSGLTPSYPINTDASNNLVTASVTGTGFTVLQTGPTLTTPNNGAATGSSLNVSGQLTSTVATGTAPLVVTSTTNVANLNASTLNGYTFANPGTIGNTTAAAGNFTGVNVSGLTASSVVWTDASKNLVTLNRRAYCTWVPTDGSNNTFGSGTILQATATIQNGPSSPMATNGKFTCPYQGVYMMCCSIQTASTPCNIEARYAPGGTSDVTIQTFLTNNQTANTGIFGATITYYCNANDVLYFKVTSGSIYTLTAGASACCSIALIN